MGLTSSLQAEWLILLRWESRTALSLLAPQIIGSEHHFTLTLRGAHLFHVVLPPICALPPRGWKGLLTPGAVFGGERACWGGHLDASLNLRRGAEGIQKDEEQMRLKGPPCPKTLKKLRRGRGMWISPSDVQKVKLHFALGCM